MEMSLVIVCGWGMGWRMFALWSDSPCLVWISRWLPSPALYGHFCGRIFLTTEEENTFSQIPNDICTTTFFTTETINMCCQQDQERYQACQNLAELYIVMFSMWISYYLHCFLFFAIETPLCIMVWFLLWSPDYPNSQPHQFKLDKVTTHFAPDWADLHTFPYHWHVQNESQKWTFPVVKRTFSKVLAPCHSCDFSEWYISMTLWYTKQGLYNAQIHCTCGEELQVKKKLLWTWC